MFTLVIYPLLLPRSSFHLVIFGKWHYLLYSLVTAMYPRFLITFDEELNSLPVTVRVGQAVDVVGQAGRPKTITGFQTHSTPVLLAHSERAELGTEECKWKMCMNFDDVSNPIDHFLFFTDSHLLGPCPGRHCITEEER